MSLDILYIQHLERIITDTNDLLKKNHSITLAQYLDPFSQEDVDCINAIVNKEGVRVVSLGGRSVI